MGVGIGRGGPSVVGPKTYLEKKSENEIQEIWNLPQDIMFGV